MTDTPTLETLQTLDKIAASGAIAPDAALLGTGPNQFELVVTAGQRKVTVSMARTDEPRQFGSLASAVKAAHRLGIQSLRVDLSQYKT